VEKAPFSAILAQNIMYFVAQGQALLFRIVYILTCEQKKLKKYNSCPLDKVVGSE